MTETNAAICRLSERCLIKLTGPDAASLLQSLVTQDVLHLEKSQLVYGCLLTPQGRFLHDFFISREEDGFFLECETARREDLIRRLNIFKLRAKVAVEDCQALFDVYVATGNSRGFQDPRLKMIGYRFYLPIDKEMASGSSQAYKDRRIALGVPEGSIDIKPEVDTLFDVNLDRLNSISWDKGCYVGQEVTARMNYRALVKKRMMIVTGQGLIAGAGLMQGGYPVGEIRSVNSSGTQGLAVLKLAVLQESANIMQPDGAVISASLPDWL